MESYYESEEEKTFTQREIEKLTCVTSLVESILRANSEYPHSEVSEFSYSDIENASTATCEDCGCIDITNNICDDCESDEIGHPYKEIMQWFIIDDFQRRHLMRNGEPILDACGLSFWGRTCYGQSIELDGIFQKIYRFIEMVRIDKETEAREENERDETFIRN